MMRRLPVSPAPTLLDVPGGGVTMLSEVSASMSPIIRAGDHLAVAWASGARPRPGAVVAYFDGRRVVAHRLIRWMATGFLARGDALADADPPVESHRYCGEIVTVRRPDDRTLDLTSRRWRLAGRALAATEAVPGRRLRWIVTRTVCHLAARCLG